jgi:CheY-like chemotaxis protein
VGKDKTQAKRILVIDDDITALDIVSFLLEEKGFAVERCVDGFAAIESVQKVSPDLIVVDLMMPGINGVSTVREMRSRGLKTIPIIAFTAVDDPRLHDEARDAGCNLVLTKPCRPERLLQHIMKLLQE